MDLPAPPSRPPDLDDDFVGPPPREDIWIDHYLPHWSTPDRSRARFDLGGGGLRLRPPPGCRGPRARAEPT